MASREKVRTRSAPVVRTTLTAAAFEQLISYVVHGEWKAGERIPRERELCQQLGIARTSLREALKAMELIGMLDSKVGDGTFVCPRSEFLSRPLQWAFTGTDHAEFADIIEAREFLEQDLAGLAAERASEEDLLKIEAAVHNFREAMANGDPIMDLDMAFHVSVGEAAHNEVLRNAAELSRDLMKPWLMLKSLISGVPARTLKQHEAIYRAILSGDTAAARNAMHNHMEDSSQLVQQVLQSRRASRSEKTRQRTTK